MKKITWPGATLLAPTPPVLVTCGSMEKPNAITIAWTGIINSHPPKTYISVRPERYSYDIIKESGEFIVHLPTKEMVRAIDYCGVKSGRDENKLEKCGLNLYEVEGFTCPAIKEFPIALTCKVTDILPLGCHDMFMADITGVLVDESMLDENGKLCMERAGIIAYAHGQYYELGENLGRFGFSVKKPDKKKK